MGNNKANIPAGEYQYGVMFNDGSVARRWNRNTQEKIAREEVAKLNAQYGRDSIKLVRRFIGPWEEVNNG